MGKGVFLLEPDPNKLLVFDVYGSGDPERCSCLTCTGRGSLRPPAASRCSARASLRAPSRGDPPLKNLARAADPTRGFTLETFGLPQRERRPRAGTAALGRRQTVRQLDRADCTFGSTATRMVARQRQATTVRSPDGDCRPRSGHSTRPPRAGCNGSAPRVVIDRPCAAANALRLPTPIGRPRRAGFLSGGSPREGARSEARAEQRLAAGGRRLPRPVPRRIRATETASPDPYHVKYQQRTESSRPAHVKLERPTGPSPSRSCA